MTGRLRRQPLKISLPNRNRNIIKAAQPQNPTVAYNGPTPRGGLDYSRPRPSPLDRRNGAIKTDFMKAKMQIEKHLKM